MGPPSGHAAGAQGPPGARGEAPGVGVTVVLDNGGGWLKAGFAGQASPVRVVPNLVAKAKGVQRRFVADQVDRCDDVQGLGLSRPVDRGYVVDWDLQREIWDHVFTNVLKINPRECHLVVTEPVFNFPSLQKAMDEMVLNDFGFRSYCRVPAPAMGHLYGSLEASKETSGAPGALQPLRGCSLVVDCGFSFTHVVPLWEDSIVLPGVRRINVGGKVLTNVLKECVSYRSLNMMDEPYLVEQVKEALCFCAIDPIRTHLPASKKGPFRDILQAEYVLPDGARHRRGFVRDPVAARAALDAQRPLLGPEEGGTGVAPKARGSAGGGGSGGGGERAAQGGASRAPLSDDQQILSLGSERFMVPEALFHPFDIGVPQAGLAEAITSALEAVPPPLRRFFYANVVLMGGSTKFPLFKERLTKDLRALVPDDIEIVIRHSPQPELSAWRGAALFASSQAFQEFRVTREEFLEKGHAICKENLAYQTFT